MILSLLRTSHFTTETHVHPTSLVFRVYKFPTFRASSPLVYSAYVRDTLLLPGIIFTWSYQPLTLTSQYHPHSTHILTLSLLQDQVHVVKQGVLGLQIESSSHKLKRPKKLTSRWTVLTRCEKTGQHTLHICKSDSPDSNVKDSFPVQVGAGWFVDMASLIILYLQCFCLYGQEII